MKNTFLALIAILSLVACSSDDEDSVVTTDSINQTEWGHEESDRGYYIYFSVGNSMRISHPFYDVSTKSFKNQDIEGSFTYNKPNVILSFSGECSNSGFVFSSCDVEGKVNGNTLTISDNGTDYTFENMYPNE